MSYLINLSILRRNSNYRLLYIGQSISFLGSMITYVAIPYQIYHLTQSTLMVGLLSLFQLLPLLVTALLGGVIADRHHRKKLLFFTESMLALGCLALAINAALPAPHLWVIFVSAITMSAITGLHRPALESLGQQIIAKNDFAMASSLSSFTLSLAMIGGPAIGGIIIDSYGLPFTFLVDFVTFFVSLIALLCMAPVPKQTITTDESTFTALMQGLRYAGSRQELLGTYFIDFAAMIFGMPMALFPAIAQAYGGVKTLGMLYAAPAVGALFFSLFSGWTKGIKRQGVAISIAAMLWGVSIICFGLISNLFIALFFLALAGGFDAISGIFRQTMWNETIPHEYRGRLAGIEMISYMSGPKLGDTEAGVVAAIIGVTGSVVSGGVLCVLGVVVSCWCLPKFWHYRAETTSAGVVDE